MWFFVKMWPRTFPMDYVIVSLAVVGLVSSAIMGDECDWTGR
jgi:hypothetical protein